MKDVIYEMSRKGLGMTTVVENDKLVGLLSDGDLRRLLEREGAKRWTGLPVRRCITSDDDFCRHAGGRGAALYGGTKITSLVVVDADGRVEGVVHLHDLWGMELF